ncbi:hypothetical protein O988_03791 [Pseudogymnoascus sp. VKM F-3808]|nr:hypothetical protein O988_03791 [Pseudogymnoascus sp. VKM F-3808]
MDTDHQYNPKSDIPSKTTDGVEMFKVIIMGTSIGGLALAQLLMSVPGILVTYYESGASVGDRLIESHVMLSGSTLKMLRHKLRNEVWAHLALGIGRQPEGGGKVAFFKENGDKMLTWESYPTKDQFPVSSWQLRKALVHQIECIIKVGNTFERYELLPKRRARVYFSDETTDECDLLVGADGWNSTVRKQLIPHSTAKNLEIAIIHCKVPLTPKSLGLLGSPGRSVNSLIPFASRYTPLTIEPEESYIMFVAGSQISNFCNRRCMPNCLTSAELKAELIERTSKPGIHPRFAELAQMVCTDTAYVSTVYKCKVIRPWASQTVTLLGDAVFNMSNVMSGSANYALLDAISLAECLTSPKFDQCLPTSLNNYVNENIERRVRQRHRSFLMQNIMFFGRNRLQEYVRNKALPLVLRRIDDLNGDGHGCSEDWVADENAWRDGSCSSTWVEELRWEQLYDERHG